MKPILFSTGMVQAILAGRKTMTRRVIKNQDGIHPRWNTIGWLGWDDGHGYKMRQPYDVGDVLWVRESWQEIYDTEYNDNNPHEPLKITDLIKDFENLPKVCAGLSREWSCASMPARNKYYVYAASRPEYTSDKYELKWRASTHMPREAARLFLRVTDVRVENLQDITLKDIEQEGLYCDPEYADPTRIVHYAYEPGMRVHFTKLWDARNAKRGYGWDSNPLVWVIEFEKCDPE